MKKILFLGMLASTVLVFSACKKNNGCSQSEKAVVRDFSETSDTCGILFQLEDGTKLEPNNLTEYPLMNYEEGELVWLSYKAASGTSICGLGDVVKIKCISEREY